MGNTDIPYCDKTWDLTIGCRKRSPGCANCWATRTVHRLAFAEVRGYCGDDELCVLQTSLDGKNWEPTKSVNLLHWNLGAPLGWRKSRFIFTNSKSDLFDDRVPFAFIGRAFDVMAQCRQHRFMVLTKEPGRMAEFIAWYSTPGRRRMGAAWPDDFPHVILMTSIEDAGHLYRWDQLAAVPAAKHGISFEPLIYPVAGRLSALFAQARPDWSVIGCEKRLGGRVGRWSDVVATPESWWAEAGAILRHCRDGGIRVWMKQGPQLTGSLRPPVVVTVNLADFPANCRIQERPNWNL